jgi:trimethylamine---corrinoid protein Co-methyltransferase
MGATGPATVVGTVVLANAELLFGVVLTQLVQAGAKIVLKPDTNVFDMRTTQVTYGSPEQDLGKVAMIQLARRYQIPIYCLGGGVECKVPDAEAAAEAMLSMLVNGLAGATLNQSLGSLAWGLYGSPEMVVICDEMVSMIKRVLDGITVNDDTIGLDVIRAVGPGGNFLDQDHTIQYFRKELYYPRLFKRLTIDEWVHAGSKMIHEVAHERVEQILSQAKPLELAADVDAALERALNKACGGNAHPRAQPV